MASKKDNFPKGNSLEQEYQDLMKNYIPPASLQGNSQWKAQGDYFVKFSLYKQTESAPTTANTKAQL